MNFIFQKIRAAIHRDVKAICSETLHFLGLEMTKSAMDVIAELVYKKLLTYGGDLEAFSKLITIFYLLLNLISTDEKFIFSSLLRLLRLVC